jgi:hypothetical protein
LKITKSKVKYVIKKSIRATSAYCNTTKNILRPVINEQLNFCNQYDIPSAVPSLFRLLNHNIFNIDENLRQIILDEAGIKTILTEKKLKPLLYRLIFAKSYEQSYALAKHSNEVDLFSLCHWKNLYDATHNIIGDTKLSSEIFKYESILELRTVLALREQNYYTSNVYDCFYSEATPDIIKNELKKQSIILHDDFVNNRI